jgi:hypothetical protein
MNQDQPYNRNKGAFQDDSVTCCTISDRDINVVGFSAGDTDVELFWMVNMAGDDKYSSCPFVRPTFLIRIKNSVNEHSLLMPQDQGFVCGTPVFSSCLSVGIHPCQTGQ